MNLLRTAMVISIAALTPALAFGQVEENEIRALTVDQLKIVYLACSGRALRGELGSGAIARCSVVYEELKQRAFGGDFDRLLAWSRQQSHGERVSR